MKVYVILPARYGSSRFKGKPLALIAGQPMIQHVYERAQRVADVDRVIVATDDDRIFKTVQDFGGEAVMTESTHPSGTDRVAEAVDILDLDHQDIVVNIQGDQPAFDPGIISQIVKPLQENAGLEMATPAIHITDDREIENPNDVKVVFDRQGLALYFSRAVIPWPREGDRSHFYKHIGIYAYRASFLREFVQLPPGRLEEIEKLEQLRAMEHGYQIKVILTTLDSPEVDTPEDIAKVEAYLKRINQ